MEAALRGRNGVSAPAGWTELETTLAAAPDEETRRLARNLGTVFGSPRALETLRTIAANPQAAGADRTAAVDTLLRTRDAALVPLLQNSPPKPESEPRRFAVWPHSMTPRLHRSSSPDSPSSMPLNKGML